MDIVNSDVVTEINEVTQLQAAQQKSIRNLSENIVPVLDVNPKHSRRITIVRRQADSTVGTLTLYTTPVGRDFYLCASAIGFSTDVTSDGTTLNLQVTLVDGTVMVIHSIRQVAGTVRLAPLQVETFQPYPLPIPLKQGTTITLVNNGTVGVNVKHGEIFGYEVASH